MSQDPWNIGVVKPPVADIPALEAELEAIFTNRSQLIMPDEVRGNASNVEEAITTDGWPIMRGWYVKDVIFFLGSANIFVSPSANGIWCAYKGCTVFCPCLCCYSLGVLRSVHAACPSLHSLSTYTA